MKRHLQMKRLMGCAFELCVVEDDSKFASEMLKMGIAELERIERLFTEFSDDSITAQINADSGIRSTLLCSESFDLIARAIAISKLTRGAFDITVGPLKKLYNFKNSDFAFPTKDDITKALDKIGSNKITLDAITNTIFLSKEEMHISFAAIGKGYAADKVAAIWRANGLQSGYINASGDLTAIGTRENGNLWNIGIANPEQKGQMLFHIPVKDMSVATSGDYEQYFIYQGKRYSHNINPHTGLPLESIRSVSVFSPKAELSDALATAVSVMGAHKGMDFINQLPQTDCVIISANQKIYLSDNLQYEAVA